MRTFDSRDNALDFREIVEGVHSLLVRSRHIFSAANVVQISVLGADARIIKAGRDGIYGRDLAVFILQELGLHAVENAQATVSDSSGVFGIIHAEAGRFNANQAHILVLDKVVEHAHSVGATAYTGDEHIG